MIADLMQPEDEARNEHKRMQLRELAALNGTLKARRCPLCWSVSDAQLERPEDARACCAVRAHTQKLKRLWTGAQAEDCRGPC